MAFDNYLLDLAQKAGLPCADGGEVLLRKPFEQAVEAGARINLLARLLARPGLA